MLLSLIFSCIMPCYYAQAYVSTTKHYHYCSELCTEHFMRQKQFQERQKKFKFGKWHWGGGAVLFVAFLAYFPGMFCFNDTSASAHVSSILTHVRFLVITHGSAHLSGKVRSIMVHGGAKKIFKEHPCLHVKLENTGSGDWTVSNHK